LEELKAEFQRTYPMEKAFEWVEMLKTGSISNASSTAMKAGKGLNPVYVDKLSNQGLDAMKQLGFGVKPEERKNPYADYGEQTEAEKGEEKGAS
jgi:hypothetical protein